MIPGVGDLHEFVRTASIVLLFAIVFAESGLLFGFFLPGDSLLFTAGVLAAEGTFSLPVLLVGFFVSAVVGDQVGYLFGSRVGPSLFRRPDSRIFKREYVERSQLFFERHGAKTIVLARFVPIVRTFAPILAGVGNMPYRKFVVFNIVGGLLWGVGVTLAGYALGEAIGEDIDKYLLPIIVGIVVVSVIPIVIERTRSHRRGRADRT